MTDPTLGDLIEVADVETIVRLDGTGGRLGQLVLTGDVVDSLSRVLEAAADATCGAGFFVVGPFGSGKSHFLASAGELLERPAATAVPAGLREGAAKVAPFTSVAVPLVDYRATVALEDVVAERAGQALGRPVRTAEDRRATWDAVLDACPTGGLVLLLDELSEFLRAKQGAPLTEDLRFLQFLGEWASGRRVIVLAALQESIEEIVNVSRREMSRIRDRYRPSLTLSMRHVEDLVRGRLVRLHPDAGTWVTRAHDNLTTAFPDYKTSAEQFGRCYPLHPETLAVLEGLRFLFSQQRGVVDFVCTRLKAGLDRRYDALITPDEIFDHFRLRLLERAETNALAETVVPYFERAVEELLDEEDRSLGLRAVKLLSLLAASPLERPRTAAELAGLLLERVSDLDPAANTAYLERAVLEPLAGRGAYIVAEGGAYSVAAGADAAVVARDRVAQARSELTVADRRIVATLVELGSTPQLPLQLLGELGVSRREVTWQNTLRTVVVLTARVLDLTPAETDQFVAQARATGAEGALVIGEIEPDEAPAALDRARALASDRLAFWIPAALRVEEIESALLVHSRASVLAGARREGRAELVDALERELEGDRARARDILRRAYFEGSLLPGGSDLPALAGTAFDRQLPTLVDPLLSALHPRHREVAPRNELVGDRLVRQALEQIIVPGRVNPATAARDRLRPLAEHYLVPLGLARARNDGITISPDPARGPAVAEALRVVGDGEPRPTTEVLAELAAGPFGLSGPEALLVLNTCVQAGLIEAWRGKKRHRDPFMTATSTDRLSAGTLVAAALRASVAALSPITGPGPMDPWTATVQRDAWEQARQWLAERREDLAQVRSGLERAGEIATLGFADPGPLPEDLAAIGSLVDGIDPSMTAPAGLQALADAIPAAEPVLAAARRLGGLGHFLRANLVRLQEAAEYLTSPDLTIPPEEDGLLESRTAALNAVQETLRLVAEDRGPSVLAACEEFKRLYTAVYESAHDRHYSAVEPRDVDRLRAEPAYQALRRLSSIGVLAVPDDVVKVDRLISRAAPPPCRRRVAHELAWKPRCQCGYALGDTPPEFDRAALLVIAGRGIEEYREELLRPEVAERLAGAAEDLGRLGRRELADELRHLADGDAEWLAGALTEELVSVVRDVLSGGQLIARRDLAALRDDLVGRRYPKRKLLQVVEQWLDGAAPAALPAGAFVEVIDSAETDAGRPDLGDPDPRHPDSPRPGAPGPVSAGGTAAFLRSRFPGLAALLPAFQAADAFWLAAWWAGRPAPPSWLPPQLLADPDRLAAATEAARGDLSALAELGDLDERVGADSLLGQKVTATVDPATQPTAELGRTLREERLLTYPARLAAGELARRLAADYSVHDLIPEGSEHLLLSPADWAALDGLRQAARHLAEVERRLGAASASELVEQLYPTHLAPVPGLLSRAALGCGRTSLLRPDDVETFRAAAARLLRAADERFRAGAAGGHEGCLAVWDIGEVVVRPLLETHGRVAVLVVDAMRADVATALLPTLGRPVRSLRWAVVPVPTRTAEAMAALRLGRPVPAGSTDSGSAGGPFAHLGWDVEILRGADRDHEAARLQQLWSSGPPVSVAVASSLDERLHHTSVELAGLLDDALAACRRRIRPALEAIPPGVPLVVLADHGFRENPGWGRGPEGRYVHGGDSLEESVIPVAVLH